MGTFDIVLLCVIVFIVGTVLGFGLWLPLLVLSMREKKNKPVRVQQEESPCETCLRWPECNGVDEDCPERR